MADRKRYRGGAKARGMEDGLFSSDLPLYEINPRLKNAQKYDNKLLRSEYTRMRDIAQKRLKRMEKAGVGDWILEQYPHGFKKLKEIKDRDSLVMELSRVSRFLSAKRSSVSGIKDTAKKTAASIEKKTDVRIAPDQLSNYGHFINSMKKYLGLQKGQYESKYIVEVWSDLKNKGKITKKDLTKAVEKYISDRRAEEESMPGPPVSQKMKESREAFDRRLASRISHRIDKYFDESDISKKTLAGIRRRKK